MGYKQKQSIIKKTIIKSSNFVFSKNHNLKSCNCNLCKGKLVDPRTRKAYMIKKEIPARNFLDVGKVAATIDLPEDLLLEMDIPEDPIDLPEAPYPEMDILED